MDGVDVIEGHVVSIAPGFTVALADCETLEARRPENHRPQIRPPSKHQLALLTVINLAFGDWLRTMSPVTRTFVLATIAVPIVIYGLMPHLHRLRVRLLTSSRTG